MSRIIFIRLFLYTQTKTEQISSQLQFVINLNLTRTTSRRVFFFIYFLVEVAFLVAAVLLAF